MVWVAVGAAGGIYAYKKVSRLVVDARGRSLVGNVNAATTSANQMVTKTKALVAAAAATATADPASVPGEAAGDTAVHPVATRLRTWIPQRSDADSSPSSPSEGTPRSQAPH
jgi:hypothetical protein